MVFMNRPLQVYLDEGDLERLESWSHARGWTKSQAVRAAIRALVQAEESDPLLQGSAMFEGLPADASTRFEQYLGETFVREKHAPYAPRKRTSRSTVR